jgi:hypothetical protein
LRRLKEKKEEQAKKEREMILSEESYEKGPVDAYSDEFADDLMKKLEK